MPTTTTDHVDLDKILSAAVDGGASDVHLKAGRPPIARCDGELGRFPTCRRSSPPELDQS